MGFLIIILIVVGSSVIAGRLAQARNLNIAFSRLASSHAGYAHTGSIFQRPFAQLFIDGVELEVNCYRQGSLPIFAREFTQVVLPWHDSDIWAMVTPAHRLPLFSWIAGQIKTGNAAFDRSYQIQSSNPAAAVELISAGVQTQIDALKHLGQVQDIAVEFGEGRIFIRKRGLISELVLLTDFVLKCVELYQQLELSRSAGIEILDEHYTVSEVQDETDETPVCLICGDEIEYQIVYCRACETPHHLDCWKYNGSCSTYGCGETSFITQRRMRRIQRKDEARKLFGS